MADNIHEAFVYIWYDALNKMFYLGKHKGTPDDLYTHSSISSKEFCSIVPHSTISRTERRVFMKNIPKGISRKILAYGTNKEMCLLEHKLLVNRKNRCWDRYYNQSLGDPRYIEQFGENNPNYKHGRTVGGAYDPICGKKYRDNPENKSAKKAYQKEYRNRPEYKEERKVYDKKYRNENREKINTKARECYDPVKRKEMYERKKLEKVTATLDNFM